MIRILGSKLVVPEKHSDFIFYFKHSDFKVLDFLLRVCSYLDTGLFTLALPLSSLQREICSYGENHPLVVTWRAKVLCPLAILTSRNQLSLLWTLVFQLYNKGCISS